MNKEQIEKIGNTIIFLAGSIQNLYITKLLKIIYLLEEISFKERGIPFLALNYKVWQAGPVNRDVYIDINDGVIIFKEYFGIKHTQTTTQIFALKEFNDDEFSDSDMELLERLTNNFKSASEKDLIEITHRPSSLWYRKAKDTGVLELFNQGMTNSSEIELNLEDLIIGQKDKIKKYNAFMEFQRIKAALSGKN